MQNTISNKPKGGILVTENMTQRIAESINSDAQSPHRKT